MRALMAGILGATLGAAATLATTADAVTVPWSEVIELDGACPSSAAICTALETKYALAAGSCKAAEVKEIMVTQTDGGQCHYRARISSSVTGSKN